MLTHKRIRERQAECRAAYVTGSMTIAAYVDTMTKLNAELKQAEEKMYDAAGHFDQIDLLRFITGTIPAAFKKIHARFPHLTFDEVIAFEQTVREAGGSIMTHSGMFVPTYRTWHYNEHCILARKSVVISWGCCHSRGYDGKSGTIDVCRSYNKTNQYGAYDCEQSGGLSYDIATNKVIQRKFNNSDHPSSDLMNRDPLGHCDNPIVFSLADETNRCDAVASPSQKNEESIAKIESATQAQIDKIEGEISDLRRKAGHLDDLLKTLRTLSSI